jgi:hypothetical protein
LEVPGLIRTIRPAVFGWLGFVLVAFALGNVVGMDALSANEPGPGESGRVQQILNDKFEQPAKLLPVSSDPRRS